MNNNVLAVVGGVVVLIIAVIIIMMMGKDPVGVPADATSTTTSSSTAQTAAQREADFQAQRQTAEENEVAFAIDVSTLPQAQQTALAVMGINSSSTLNITNKMMTCAGTDMSATRMAEIKGGASVTAGEGIKLVGCYNANN